MKIWWYDGQNRHLNHGTCCGTQKTATNINWYSCGKLALICWRHKVKKNKTFSLTAFLLSLSVVVLRRVASSSLALIGWNQSGSTSRLDLVYNSVAHSHIGGRDEWWQSLLLSLWSSVVHLGCWWPSTHALTRTSIYKCQGAELASVSATRSAKGWTWTRLQTSVRKLSC